MRQRPFTIRIPDAEKDDTLAETLIRDEASGILAWAGRGCLEEKEP